MPFFTHFLGLHYRPKWGTTSLENYLYDAFKFHFTPMSESISTKFYPQFMSVMARCDQDLRSLYWWEKYLKLNFANTSKSESSTALVPLSDFLKPVENIVLIQRDSSFKSPHTWTLIPRLNKLILTQFPHQNQITSLYLDSRLDDEIAGIISSKYPHLRSLVLSQHCDEQVGITDVGLEKITDSMVKLVHFGLVGVKECTVDGIQASLQSFGALGLEKLELARLRDVGLIDLSAVGKACPELKGLRVKNCFVTGDLKFFENLTDIELNDLESKDIPLQGDVFEDEEDSWMHEAESADVKPKVYPDSVTTLPSLSALFRDDDVSESESDYSSDDNDGPSINLDGISPVEFARMLSPSTETLRSSASIIRSMMNSIVNAMLPSTSYNDSNSASTTSLRDTLFSTANGAVSSSVDAITGKSVSKRPTPPGDFSLAEALASIPNPNILRRVCAWINGHNLFHDQDQHKDLIGIGGKNGPTRFQRIMIGFVSGCTQLECLQMSSGYVTGAFTDWFGYEVEDVESSIIGAGSSRQQMQGSRPLYKKSVGVLRTFNRNLKYLECEIDVERARMRPIDFKGLIGDTERLPLLKALKLPFYLSGEICYRNIYSMGRINPHDAAEFLVGDRYSAIPFASIVRFWEEKRAGGRKLVDCNRTALSYGDYNRLLEFLRKSETGNWNDYLAVPGRVCRARVND